MMVAATLCSTGYAQRGYDHMAVGIRCGGSSYFECNDAGAIKLLDLHPNICEEVLGYGWNNTYIIDFSKVPEGQLLVICEKKCSVEI